MKVYKVKTGKYYFKGNKFQPAILQYTFTLILLVLYIIFGSVIFLICSALNLVIFSSIAQQEMTLDSIRVCFSDSCAYKLTENYDQINKLYGFAEGFHHWNSARIGWRCVDGVNIELMAYAYTNGKRISKPMLKCKTGEWIFCCIQKKQGKYVFKALCPTRDSITVSIDMDKKWSFYSLFKLFTYKLYPYFGGKISAPNDMDISIVKLRLNE